MLLENFYTCLVGYGSSKKPALSVWRFRSGGLPCDWYILKLGQNWSRSHVKEGSVNMRQKGFKI